MPSKLVKGLLEIDTTAATSLLSRAPRRVCCASLPRREAALGIIGERAQQKIANRPDHVRRGWSRARMDSTRSVTPEERRRALDVIAAEVSVCTRCPLHATRTMSVPGEGHQDTEVVFVGEGPGYNEDQQGRPFVGAAGSLLNELLRQ